MASMIKGALLNLSKANSPDLGGDPTTASGASPASVIPSSGMAALIFASSALNRAVLVMKSVVVAVSPFQLDERYSRAVVEDGCQFGGQILGEALPNVGPRPPHNSARAPR